MTEKTWLYISLFISIVISIPISSNLVNKHDKYIYDNKLLDSISMSYDKSYGILKSQSVIIDSYDSLGFNNTLMLIRKIDSLNNIEKEKREKYGKNIHKGNR